MRSWTTGFGLCAALAWLICGSAAAVFAGGSTSGCPFGCPPGFICFPGDFFGGTCCPPGTVQSCGFNCCTAGQTCENGFLCVDPTSTPTMTPTPTATPTSTETPTNTPIPNGGSCIDPADCSSGNCVDDVCCDTVCTEPLRNCNVPGQVGVCSDVEPAPTLSPRSEVFAIILLAGTAAWAFRRRVR